MKIEHITRFSGPVNREDIVTIEETKENTNKLRDALAIVDKYRRLANTKVSTKWSDWSMFEYCVKNDKVIVTIKQGACG